MVVNLLSLINLIKAAGSSALVFKVIGFLTILGYSLYDTVVVFDKVRENTKGIGSKL